MKHPIGFCVQPKAPEAASPTPAAQPEAAAVPSVVRVYFPERDRAYSYYNDRFDLHAGDFVYVSGKLAGQRGRVTAVDYNFRIRLADYERVIGVVDTTVRGTFYVFGSHMLTLDHGALPYAQVRSWFFPPEAEGEFVTGHGPGPEYALDALEQTHVSSDVAEKGSAYYAENRVVYLSVDGTQGHAIVQGSTPYELTFTYTGGTVSALTCTCYETGLCKHGAALLLQLRETVDFLREEHEEAFAASDRFAAVSKRIFSHFAMDGSAGGCITLT